MSEIAPVALFTYNRPEHTRRTVESLAAGALASQTDLHIFSDAPKNPGAAASVAAVRAYLKTIQGFKSVVIVERETNMGLAESIIGGATDIINRRGRVIVLEDDMVVSPFFLEYMNDALHVYREREDVISIHAYIYPVDDKLPETFLIGGADCWGWATWKRGWDLFRADGEALLRELRERKLTERFNFENSYPYLGMLEDQIRGTNDSWAIRWYASALLAGKTTVYPGRSLVHNIGNDDSGTHASASDVHDVPVADSRLKVEELPPGQNEKAFRAMRDYFRRHHAPGASNTRADNRAGPPLWKKIAWLLTPPIFVRIYQKLRGARVPVQSAASGDAAAGGEYGFSGNYPSWEEASSRCGGYDSDAILIKCRDALLKVKNGEAVYERDSVLFDEIQYSWPLLAGLLRCAAEHDGRLNVLDFGGSLGSSFYQNRTYLSELTELTWNIVEQSNFVGCGREYFQDEQLRFYETIEACLAENKVNVLLASSSMPYLPDPFAFAEEFQKHGIPYIIIDRTYFIDGNDHRLTIQKVPPSIYDAAYPAWFFNREKFLDLFAARYRIVSEFDSYLTAAEYVDGVQARESGVVFKAR